MCDIVQQHEGGTKMTAYYPLVLRSSSLWDRTRGGLSARHVSNEHAYRRHSRDPGVSAEHEYGNQQAGIGFGRMIAEVGEPGNGPPKDEIVGWRRVGNR